MAAAGGKSDASTHALVRIWLPDRPGALALVAARIGAVGGDIVSVDVLEHAGGIAVDEFSVILPDEAVLDLMTREIEQVDGASVERVRLVGAFPDPRIDALESAVRLCQSSTPTDLHGTLVGHVRTEFLADWSVLLQGEDVLSASGDDRPTGEFLSALATGTTASPHVADGTSGPDDLLVAGLAGHDAVLLVGRDGNPFRRSERAQLVALANIADRTWTLLDR